MGSLLQRVEGNSLCGRRRPRQEVPETSQQTQFVSTGSGKNREHSCCQPFHQLLICWYIFLPNGARFRCVTDNIVSTARFRCVLITAPYTILPLVGVYCHKRE